MGFTTEWNAKMQNLWIDALITEEPHLSSIKIGTTSAMTPGLQILGGMHVARLFFCSESHYSLHKLSLHF